MKKRYPKEMLQGKTKDELIELVDMLQETVAMLDFLIAEYEAMQESVGRSFKDKLVEHFKNTVIDNIETGEA